MASAPVPLREVRPPERDFFFSPIRSRSNGKGNLDGPSHLVRCGTSLPSLGTLIVRNLDPGELAGKTVTPQPAGPDLIFIVDDDTGIYDFAKQSSRDSVPQMLSVPYYQYVQKPVALGTNWEDKSQTVLFAKTVSVQRRCTIDMVDDHATVPAGTFKNRIRVRCAGSTLVPIESRGVAEVSVETYSWYAPGLGRVRWTTREKNNNQLFGPGEEFSVELVSFSR